VNAGTANIVLSQLKELWLNTGTACNLSCPFCHEGSSPGDSRVPALGYEQACRTIDAAMDLGVERFAFTGGEPLILRDIQRILLYALDRRPCLVLTNGTAPMIRRTQHLAQLRSAPHPLSFRVSIDYADEAAHDAGRGLRNFRKAVQGLKLLFDAGFEVGVTRRLQPDENAAVTDARFRQIFTRNQLPRDLSIVALPELGPLHASVIPAHASVSTPRAPMCATSRTAQALGDGVAFTPCPMVDDDPQFLIAGPLDRACGQPVRPIHPRCELCRTIGIAYSG
jgi:sulfatase maturation enzyme AslB (radical SAM superfamily)